MREILFRGKRIDNGEWAYGGYSYHSDLSRGFVVNVGVDNVSPIAWVVEVDPATVGQYTGLSDKNGKQIFEGDIVKTVALANDHHQRGAVMISPVVCWMGNTCLSITYVPLYPLCVDHDIEVVGNTHDNPEYLEPAP